MVHEGHFRADLLYHLNIARIELPPLRQRKEDIIIMANYFLEAQAKLYNESSKTLIPSAIEVLCNYSWPGNIQELANVIERAFIKSKSRQITTFDLPDKIATSDMIAGDNQNLPTMDEVNKKLIIRALEATKGHKIAAAKSLGIDHRKLSRLLSKFNIDISDYKE